MSEATPSVPPELEEKLAELAILQQAVEEQKKKAAEYYDQLVRFKAEFENFRKRSEKEKIESRAWGKQEVLLPLLQLVDVFEQAMSQARHSKDVSAILTGLEFLHKSFSGFLKAEGLEPIDVVGKPFDPHVAEAVEQVEVDESQAGRVLSEVQRGYRFKGQVLRPSQVRVGVAKSGTNQETDLPSTPA
jgi:molecular chaperone GrpE